MNQEKITELDQLIGADYGNTAGICVMKNGEKVYEHYFNGCTAESPVHIFSATKSIISLLIGIAIDQGAIQSVEQKVLEFYPEYEVNNEEETIQEITIEELLTMTAPYKHQEENYIDYFTSENWVEYALDLLGGPEKTGMFRYTPIIGPDILSGIIERATGQSVIDFARANLFSPLEIRVDSTIIFKNQEEQLAFYEAREISGWVADPNGVNTAGWGLTLTTEDLAKIGELCLNQGSWKGKQIISKEWIANSTKEHSHWDTQLFGYLWWIVDEGERSYAALGDGGNVIYVNLAKQLVVSMTGFFLPESKDRLMFIQEKIEPFLD